MQAFIYYSKVIMQHKKLSLIPFFSFCFLCLHSGEYWNAIALEALGWYTVQYMHEICG